MIELPQRRAFATREDFAAAVSAAFEELWGRYLTEQVSTFIPEWALGNCESVGMPLSIARDGGDAHGVSSIIKHAIERKWSAIDRIARVEHDGVWRVFFEAK